MCIKQTFGDFPDDRPRRTASRTAMLQHSHHHKLRLLSRKPARKPRMIRFPRSRFCCARLARNSQVGKSDSIVPGADRVVHSRNQTLAYRLKLFIINAFHAPSLGQACTSGFFQQHGLAVFTGDMRRHQPATIGNAGCESGQLQRGHRKTRLADRKPQRLAFKSFPLPL